MNPYWRTATTHTLYYPIPCRPTQAHKGQQSPFSENNLNSLYDPKNKAAILWRRRAAAWHVGANVSETQTAPIFRITDDILDVTLYVHDAPRPY